jgi:hypothetical protein|tara:strand:+ start:143 stop:706 length:564 start_codon:yes stop_codon:yes gene_type:complete
VLKILIISLLNLLIFSNTANAGRWGEGELQLTKQSADYFITFIRGKGNKKPSDFYISLDGTYATYWTCSYSQCSEGNALEDIKYCERKSGKKCAKFAFRRTIKWKNGINPAKGKASTIHSKWSDAKIYAKLTELGFYNNNFSIKKETDVTDNSSTQIVNQIKELKKLLDEGILSKEEFEAAKKKMLN